MLCIAGGIGFWGVAARWLGVVLTATLGLRCTCMIQGRVNCCNLVYFLGGMSARIVSLSVPACTGVRWRRC